MSVIYGNPITLGGVDIKISQVLNENSWKAIKWASKNNVGQNLWAVGDCKEVTLNGKVSDGLTLTDYTACVYIIGFNHNAEKEGNGITFQGFKATDNGTDVCLVDSSYGNNQTNGTWLNMNNSRFNSGGWQASRIRTEVMPLIKSSLPADLQAVIKTSTIYTAAGEGNIACTASDDDLFLLGEYELFGERIHATTEEPNYLKQYDYYSAGNSKVKYRHDSTGSAAVWWLRSPYASYSTSFCVGVANGVTTGSRYADFSFGVSPVFKV